MLHSCCCHFYTTQLLRLFDMKGLLIEYKITNYLAMHA